MILEPLVSACIGQRHRHTFAPFHHVRYSRPRATLGAWAIGK
jgi:hypothetical protein